MREIERDARTRCTDGMPDASNTGLLTGAFDNYVYDPSTHPASVKVLSRLQGVCVCVVALGATKCTTCARSRSRRNAQPCSGPSATVCGQPWHTPCEPAHKLCNCATEIQSRTNPMPLSDSSVVHHNSVAATHQTCTFGKTHLTMRFLHCAILV